MRSKSEPPATSRDSRRRRHFLMEDVEAETSYDDHFINPDLETRAQIFNSEHRVRAAPYRVGGRLACDWCLPLLLFAGRQLGRTYTLLTACQ